MARAKSKPGRGGSRRGAGRKPGSLPPQLAALIPVEPPVGSPMGMARYYQSILGVLTAARVHARALGLSVSEIDNLAKEVRANATAAGKVIPHDVMFQAASIIRDEERELESDESPQEEDVIGAVKAVAANA